MTDADTALSQNLEFYRAFSTRDLAAMDRLWAREAAVSCIHPGWAPLAGRDEVLASWRAILTGPSPPTVLCFDERATLFDGVAMVVCEEQLETVSLAATNLFVMENGLWRMVHHQSSQIVQRS
ncbi:MAG TPA: nuclear transport factor 2 family protein [Aliidongia sp.]|nr:nuclear transport factor 2 family protein [Aliidongia sp.]